MNPSLTNKRPALGAALAISLLFIATGTSSLVYQVVWQRYLINIFGATIYSVSTVLAAFMGGLALGSFLFGRFADRTRHRHLAVYGVLEIAVGIFALLVPFLLKILDPVFHGLYAALGVNFLLYSVVRFVLVFLILLLPTTMMGGTLPILSKFLSPDGGGAGLRIGLLYAVNTLGAVLGTVLTGFFFIRWWGISTTVLFAASINVVAGIGAIALSRLFTPPIPSTSQTPQPAVRRSTRVRFVYWAFAISGLVALALEVAWSRSLVFTFDMLKNTTYSFTAMLATYLVGVTIGSAIMTPFVEKLRRPFRVYAGLQVIIGVTSIASFFVLYYVAYSLGSDWFREYDATTDNIRWNAAVALIFARTAVVMLLPTVLMGMAFPVAVRIVLQETRGVGGDVGRLYAVNTIGAIIGSVAAGFVLLPYLGVANTIIALGALQLTAGVLLYWSDKTLPQGQKLAWSAIAVVAVVLAFVRMPHPAILQPPTQLDEIIYYKEGPIATVAIGENTLGFRTIYVDNVGVAGTDPMLLTDQKSLAHVPMLLLTDPKSALTVGFGSGGASYSYTQHPSLKRIDCAEITRTVVEAAPLLTASNHDVVMKASEYEKRTGKPVPGTPLWNDGGESGWYKSDPRYNIVLDDVRSYLRFTKAKYDIIATDCTDLRYKSNANLYDQEYFQLTRDHITDDGMVVVWMPLAGLSDEAMRVALRTFHAVFPEMEVFFMNNQPTHYILLIGTKEPLQVDVEQMRKRIAQPTVTRDLAEIQLEQPEKILSCFITGRSALNDYLKGDILNTEDFPYLEFESPRYGYSDNPLLDNLDNLMQIQEDPKRLLAPGTSPEFLASLGKYYQAVRPIIEGHKLYRHLDIVGAYEKYAKALALNPEDTSVQELLRFDELQRKVAGQPDNMWARLMLGEILMRRNEEPKAVAEWNYIVKTVNASPEVTKGNLEMARAASARLAEVYEKAGQMDKAKAYRTQETLFATTITKAWPTP